MSSVCSLSILDHTPPWRLRLLGEAFLQPPWHDRHPARLAIEADLPPPLFRFARVIDRFVDRLCLARLVGSFKGRGSPANRPDLMLKAMLYFIHQRGLHSPADWYLEGHDSAVARWLLRGLRPSRARWYAFRKRCSGFIDDLNEQLLHAAIAEGLLDPDVSVFDGTFLAANSSRHVLVNLTNLQSRLHLLEQAIASDKAATASPLSPQAGQAAQSGHAEVSVRREASCALSSNAACATATAEAGRQAACAPGVPAETIVKVPAPATAAGAGQQTDAVASAAKTPGWLARTAGGRQRQQRRYQKAAKELGKRLLANSKRRKEDRKQHDQVRISLADAEATLGLDKEKVYRPLYNVQFCRDLRTDFCTGYGVYSTTQDAATFKPMLARVEHFTGRKVERAMTDAGYATGANLREAESRHMELIAPYQENDYSKKKATAKAVKKIAKWEFTWDEQEQTYTCPQGQRLKYVRIQTKQRGEVKEKHRQYRCPAEHCQSCVRQKECTSNPKAGRMVVRGEYDEEVDRHKKRMSSEQARTLYKKRKEQVERLIADGKEHRELRKLSMRGEDGARTQVGLTVLAANIDVFDKCQQRALAKTAARADPAQTAAQQPSAGKTSTLPTFLL